MIELFFLAFKIFASITIGYLLWVNIKSSINCYVLFIQIFCRDIFKYRHFRGPLAVPLLGKVYHSEALFLMKYLAKCKYLHCNIVYLFNFFCCSEKGLRKCLHSLCLY